MLATDAGNHLLGHLLLKQGGFTVDQQQRIRVLTDGSIDFRKRASRRLFGKSLGTTDADNGDESFYGNDGQGYGGETGEEMTVFQDLLDFDPDSGEVCVIVDEMPQDSLKGNGSHRVRGRVLEVGVLRSP